MFVCFKTIEFVNEHTREHSRYEDHYHIAESEAEVDLWRDDVLADPAIYCWGVARITDASEPHWLGWR